MPLVLGPDEARQYGELNAAPGSFLDMLATAGYRAAVAGVRLGLFAALRARPLPAAELARAIGASQRGTRLLADALTSFGYLARDGEEGYTTTPASEPWLASGEDGYALVELFWQRVLFEMWGTLEESVRTGAPAGDFYGWLERHPDTALHFQAMLRRHAELIAGEVVEAVPAPAGTGALLDIGGGHAQYAVAFCGRHAGLRATVLDLPGALSAGAEVVAAADPAVAGRVTLRPGDYRGEDLGSGYELVLLFNVLHGHEAAANVDLLRRVATALSPGGLAVVLEHDADAPTDAGRSGEAFLRTFSLNLFHGEGGQLHRLPDIAGWLTRVGLTEPTTRRLRDSPMQHLLMARKPS